MKPSPHGYPELTSFTGNWNWDKDSIVKAQGLKVFILSFQTVAVFIMTKNILDEVKALASKLENRDQDIFESHMMVDEVIKTIQTSRNNIDRDFKIWYKDILELAGKLDITEAISRKPSIQRNWSNIPCSSPIDHYKKTAAIPLLDSLIIQMQDRISDEDRHARRLLCLVPSIIANKVLHLEAEVIGMLYWEKEINGLPHSFCF